MAASTQGDFDLNLALLTINQLPLDDPRPFLAILEQLRQTVERDGQAIFQQWQVYIQRTDFVKSAQNLAYYLALRQYDLRSLQSALMPWGLSSLGRIEAKVMPTLNAVIATFSAICDRPADCAVVRPEIEAFFEGERLLNEQSEILFGKNSDCRRVRIMVTLPTEAADNYDMVREIVRRGADCVRINCAHDTVEIWQAAIGHVRRAAREEERSCQILMDLGGPKIRTGPVFLPAGKKRVFRGDSILLLREAPTDLDALSERSPDTCTISCTVPEILDRLTVGNPVYIDDGKIRTRAIDCHVLNESGKAAILLEVTHASPKGVKLRPEKGLNFPGTLLNLSPLTAKDLQDLDFVAHHADLIGYSFVQHPSDIEQLQQELASRLGEGDLLPAIVAKIETQAAVENLPDLIVRAAGKQPFAVMIARGDLAVEIGYQRLAEIQEEILWLCEAARVPAIWATQVLEGLVKNGAPSRGEMTDAAMAERADCVMLNKGPFIAEAIAILDDVLTRMEAHQLKKTPQLRALHSWPSSL